MADAPDLWHGGARKEAMDMLGVLWRTLDDDGRNTLSNVLIAGPPSKMFEQVADDERESSRDRRVFDRLIVVERVGQPPLTPALAQTLQALRARYPHWRAQDGERAHFSSWFETRWGPDTNFSVEDLAEMGEAALIARLRNDMDARDGLLDSWKQFAIAQPRNALNVLSAFAETPDDPGPADAWEAGLRGLREAKNGELITDHVLSLLGDVPVSLFEDREFVRGAADLLEAKSRDLDAREKPTSFWRLFDRALEAAGSEPLFEPDYHIERGQVAPVDWVAEAINRSMGILATAFVNAIYALRPGQGDTLGSLTERANRLMSPKKPEHRYARVIGASRISYLYAVDPAWSAKTLIPAFSWRQEEEAMAMWQGYAWQMRIDPQLWAALKPHFLPLFEHDRMQRFGAAARNVAQALMLVGIAFGPDELKREDVRNALRSMPQDIRADAAEWIVGYLEAEPGDDQGGDDEPIDGTPDSRWDQIWSWVRRVWPSEAILQTSQISEQFALAAIATDKAFPRAVESVAPYAVPAYTYHLIHKLSESTHPEQHAESSLVLLDTFVAPDPMLQFDEHFAAILERIGKSDPALRTDNRYRRWAEFIALKIK
ncbi:hypothetical protein M9978_22205 [Sphingomonas sp. MG17]|uniref:Uncharacterized protein n=1 Tax=Sphingomonas tagetis TaxID=2949092 RepID=A0A9X2HPN0_9SPHN|nr:hypothetical protein [Sphingomonas tagetis]MCP3733124.1 hypothetical protein [Sphingomonas tagetis]